MATLNKKVGDATRPDGEGSKPIIVAHVCNDEGRWGSGFVLAVNKRWGEGPKAAYQAWHGGYLSQLEPGGYNINLGEYTDFWLGGCQLVHVPNRIAIANMVGQQGIVGDDPTGRPPVRYGALGKAMEWLRLQCRVYADNHGVLPEIHCPMFGAGLAGGNWEVIEDMIQEIWVDPMMGNIDVTVYEFGG